MTYETKKLLAAVLIGAIIMVPMFIIGEPWFLGVLVVAASIAVVGIVYVFVSTLLDE